MYYIELIKEYWKFDKLGLFLDILNIIGIFVFLNILLKLILI